MIIHKKRDVQDVWAKTYLWLKNEFSFNEERGQTMQLFYKNNKIEKYETLE